MAARNNTIILGCITRSRVSRKKGGESPTLFYVGQIPWVHGLALGALQEARASRTTALTTYYVAGPCKCFTYILSFHMRQIT